MKRLIHIDVLSFAVGFVLGCLLGAPELAAPLAICGALACAVHRARFRAAPGVTIAAGFFAATICAALSADPGASEFARHVGEERTDVLIEAIIVEGPRARRDAFSYDIELRVVDNSAASGERLKLWVATRDDPGAGDGRPGDEIEVFARCARFAPREFPRQQSARRRWSARGFAAGCSALEPVTTLREADGVRAKLTSRRLRLEARLHELLGRRAGVPIAMLTGTRGFVTDSEWLAHRRAGTAHLLAISGLHFGCIASIVWVLVGMIVRRIPWLARRIGTRRASAPIVLAAMGAYLLAVGAPISATRAFVAVAALVLSVVVFRRPSGLAAISVAAVALLATNPRLVFDLGFQLSFGATLAIVLFWHRLPWWLDHDPYAFERSKWRTRLKRLVGYVFMSWLATIVTWPLLLGASGQLAVVALITNPIAVPWVGLVVFPLLVAGALSLEFVPEIGEPVVRLATEAMLRTTLWVEWAASQPGAVWTPGALVPAAVAVAVVCALVIAGSRFRPRIVSLAALVMSAALWCGVPHHSPGWHLHFIPVGQGDATLVEAPTGERILIDAGGSSWGSDPGRRVVVPYLWRIGVTGLDAIVVTHADTDHAGGVPAVLELVDVDQVVTSPADLGVAGMELQQWLGEGSKNDRSVVARVDACPATALLTGDVERAAERAQLRVGLAPVTVLKVPHHGSKTSSTEPFLDAVRPRVAVVSAGRNNRFGHPHPRVVERYEDRAIRLFSTAENGLVRVHFTCSGEIEVMAVRPPS